MKYLPRVADKMLQERLEAFGAVLIEGAECDTDRKSVV